MTALLHTPTVRTIGVASRLTAYEGDLSYARLIDDLSHILLRTNARRTISDKALKERLSDEIAAQLDDVMSMLLDCCHGLPSRLSLQSLVRGDVNIDITSEASLRSIPIELLPIAIVRALMRQHRVMVVPSRIKAWDRWTRRYSDAILQTAA